MWRRIADFLGVLGTDPASATVVVDLVPAVFFSNDFDDGVLFESTDFIVLRACARADVEPDIGGNPDFE